MGLNAIVGARLGVWMGAPRGVMGGEGGLMYSVPSVMPSLGQDVGVLVRNRMKIVSYTLPLYSDIAIKTGEGACCDEAGGTEAREGPKMAAAEPTRCQRPWVGCYPTLRSRVTRTGQPQPQPQPHPMHSQAEGDLMTRPAPAALLRFAHGQAYAHSRAPGPTPLSLFSRRLLPVGLALFVAALLALSLTLDSGLWGGEGSPGYAGGLWGAGATAGASAGEGGGGGGKGAGEEGGGEGGAAGEEGGGQGPDLSRPSKCPEGCLEHGTCNEETGECHCVTNRAGPACAHHALPRCQLAPGYTSPCYSLTTCECVQDCHALRLPINIHCLRGTLQGCNGTLNANPGEPPQGCNGTQNPNVTEVLEGAMYRMKWNGGETMPLMPDYNSPELPGPSPVTDPASCPHSCNGHGACMRKENFCECPWVAQGGACGVPERANPFTGISPACFNGCSQRGECLWGVCRCRRGYFGLDCSLYIDQEGKTRILRRKPYSWASLPPPSAEASRDLRPRVYVYDLPGYMNTWQGLHAPLLDWEEPVWFLERLLNSPYRTADPDEADFFYIPLFIRNRDSNKANLIPFALDYIRQRWPHYNASGGGANHMVLTNSDWGNCQLGGPGGYGEMSSVLDGVMTLTLWGMSKNMAGGEGRPCFRPGRDLVIPPIMVHDVYKEAPDFPSNAPLALDRKDILLFFRGSFYSEDVGAPGQYRMSFGARQEMAAHFNNTFNETGILIESMDSLHLGSHLQAMRRATFCFAPAGWGWAMRTTQAVIMGCIPLIIQPDVVQPFQGDGMDWSEFAVFLKLEDIPNVEKILRAYPPEQVLRMQQALYRVRRRFAWSSTNFNPFMIMGKKAAEAGAEALLHSDSFVGIMEALRLRLKL